MEHPTRKTEHTAAGCALFYLYYSFREALQRFRDEFHLQRKHIDLIKLY